MSPESGDKLVLGSSDTAADETETDDAEPADADVVHDGGDDVTARNLQKRQSVTTHCVLPPCLISVFCVVLVPDSHKCLMY